MKTSYPIGTLAEKIIALKVRHDGTFHHWIRRRMPDGRVIDETNTPRSDIGPLPQAEFTIRVRSGDSGVVYRESIVWPGLSYGNDIMALGHATAFPDELTPAERHDHSMTAANPDEVRFVFADGKLTWEYGNVSGVAILDARFPELVVSLRLPPGNDGEISLPAMPVAATELQSGHLQSVA